MTKTSTEIVGREKELLGVRACLSAGRNVLIEGPVGIGKTHLALAVARALGRPVFRVDGDNRYTEQKLSGWFDPPSVIKTGFNAESFFAGPLVEAMRAGGILFINELNRLPEGVQNVLLPAIDEGMIIVPRLGEIRAKEGFLVIATQNPKEFVATSHLSEAILDRFELIVLDYQSETEELRIVLDQLGDSSAPAQALSLAAVRIARITRNHPRVRRGASVRAALSIAKIGSVLLASGKSLQEAFAEAVLLALPTRIEIEREGDSAGSHRDETERLLQEWTQEALQGGPAAETEQKKKS
ncbi:MAG: MoxR family ATPase [Oligoflexia bacterium]|nr:MoxR family ATPase [Oligoflexia bacterium]